MSDAVCCAFTDRASTSAGDSYRLSQIPLGSLTITSGAIRACDPFVDIESSLQFPAPNGTFEVIVTIAHITEGKKPHLREAYLSLIFDPAPATRFTAATPLGIHNDPTKTGGYYCVAVDAGTIAFVDAHAAILMIERVEAQGLDLCDDILDSNQPDSWFNLLFNPDHYCKGSANIPLPFFSGGENIVLCSSGWGDGYYPVLAGFDAQGKLLSYHIDLQVVNTPA
ncbi:DUF4241 domain-containing protein [Corynebacterium felinum]|uniref:DUF4241 domain-containing protein n=1 Tax=Corynebacterium felinum TaxID=131318 RepID=A0ABU2BAQ5_9CORY|nr:DUF4241 domain-containing protein [Corynebacterium felinum]MDF5821815.1 DUF4241 domain-containing protein [Corynebacterium felinum]MDR7355376.1 hypothetical protein [Corynebacterium felinum]WJY94728.1 hypothetical protein CFELI_05500 [Corynebacterium felinum]